MAVTARSAPAIQAFVGPGRALCCVVTPRCARNSMIHGAVQRCLPSRMSFVSDFVLASPEQAGSELAAAHAAQLAAQYAHIFPWRKEAYAPLPAGTGNFFSATHGQYVFVGLLGTQGPHLSVFSAPLKRAAIPLGSAPIGNALLAQGAPDETGRRLLRGTAAGTWFLLKFAHQTQVCLEGLTDEQARAAARDFGMPEPEHCLVPSPVQPQQFFASPAGVALRRWVATHYRFAQRQRARGGTTYAGDWMAQVLTRMQQDLHPRLHCLS